MTVADLCTAKMTGAETEGSAGRVSRPGVVIPGTRIACDLWRKRAGTSGGACWFFLSHAHTDHMEGLSPSWRRPIYCSPVTASVLKLWFRFEDWVLKPLEVGQTHSIGDVDPEDSFCVTVLDANHIPGAVMFLFEGNFGTVLYTGDFRFDPNSSPFNEDENYMRLFSGSLTLDLLYLDNTYLNTQPESLPSRAEARDQLVNLIKANPESDVLIGLYRIGREELLSEVAIALQERICICKDRMDLFKVLGQPDVFTTVMEQTRIRVVSQRKLRKHLAKQAQDGLPAIAVLPSARPRLLPQTFVDLEDVHLIPYSDHSSSEELKQFLAKITTRKIVPIAKQMTLEEKASFQTLIPSLTDDIPSVLNGEVRRVPWRAKRHSLTRRLVAPTSTPIRVCRRRPKSSPVKYLTPESQRKRAMRWKPERLTASTPARLRLLSEETLMCADGFVVDRAPAALHLPFSSAFYNLSELLSGTATV